MPVENKTKAQKSKMMNALYGAEYADRVFNRLEELDPELNSVIQDIAYDQLWSREGLSIRDKSLVTVAALIAMGREEQTKIHITGFLNSGGKVDDLRNALLHLATYCGFPAVMNGFAALKEVTSQQRGSNGKPTHPKIVRKKSVNPRR
jgi:4-carboxymuconolactone decarboxylase